MVRSSIRSSHHHEGSACRSFSLRELILSFVSGLSVAVLFVNGVQQNASINTTLFDYNPSSSSRVLSLESTKNIRAPTSPATTNNVPTAAEQPIAEQEPDEPTNREADLTKDSSSSLLQLPPASTSHDFYEIGLKTGTDKVWGVQGLPKCLEDPKTCRRPDMVNPKCRTGQGHYYHTMYNHWLADYSRDDAEPFQFLEIGFYNGRGFDTYREFLPRAETHSMEIACIEEGPRNEGKWPWGNFAAKNPRYHEYLDTNQLHCGDASDFKFLNHTWTTKMKRPEAPPLKIVVDDGAHLAAHMATSLFFWFPRIQPGGLMIVEDIQPIQEANKFRTHVLPQVMKDLHYCGDPQFRDAACFPTIWPLLQAVHCELHICVFVRNDQPAVEYSKDQSMPPKHALNASKCLFGYPREAEQDRRI